MTMRRRVGVWVALGVLVLLASAITTTVGWRPLIGPVVRPLTDARFERTPARLERGSYLFEAGAACIGCHSEWDRTRD